MIKRRSYSAYGDDYAEIGPVSLEVRPVLNQNGLTVLAHRSGVRVSLFLIVALPFLGALLPGLMNSAGRAACAGVTFTVSLLALIGLLTHLPAVMAGELVTARIDWMPLLGLNVTLMLGGF